MSLYFSRIGRRQEVVRIDLVGGFEDPYKAQGRSQAVDGREARPAGNIGAARRPDYPHGGPPLKALRR